MRTVGSNAACEVQDSEADNDGDNGLDGYNADTANNSSDEMCETPAPRLKRQKTTTTETTSAASALQCKKQSTTKTTWVSILQKPSTLPCCRKTKQSTLTSVFSRQEIADRTSIPVENVGAPTQPAEVDSDTGKSAAAACDGSEGGMAVTEGGMPAPEEQEGSEVPQPCDSMQRLSTALLDLRLTQRSS